MALCIGLGACSEFRDRMDGYPTEDQVLDLHTASSNDIADALNQIADLALLGDDWEFEDPHDACTVRVVAADAAQEHTLNLRGARFAITRDHADAPYYATLHHGDHPVRDAQGQPLRLFETSSYPTVFFAEGYLRALAQRCEASAAQR